MYILLCTYIPLKYNNKVRKLKGKYDYIDSSENNELSYYRAKKSK